MAWRTISFNNHGGSGTAPSPVYQNTVGPFFASAQSTASQYRIFTGSTGQLLSAVPAKSGNVFMGFYTSESGGTKYISSSGYWQYAAVLSSDITLHAQWRDYYIITLDANEGTPGTSEVYYKIDGGGLYLDASLTTPATTVAPPTGGGVFKGYAFNDVLMIDENGNVTDAGRTAAFSADATFTAQWNTFGRVVDYFGLASASLVPFESDAGENRPHIVTRHYGRHSANARTGANQSLSRITAEQTGPVWRNPTVKYMVVSDTTIATYLGKAYAAETGTIYGPYPSGSSWVFGNHSGMTKTGYMIVSVTVDTRTRRFPVVTVQGVANEGADAINKFFISVPVKARAQAQNLLGAVSGGGELQSCTLAATCNPVALQEGLAPCASDVVDGHYELHAETQAASGEAAPTCTSAGGFAALGEPAAMEGKNYARYRLTARKEIV